jgi:hypothetical protein
VLRFAQRKLHRLGYACAEGATQVGCARLLTLFETHITIASQLCLKLTPHSPPYIYIYIYIYIHISIHICIHIHRHLRAVYVGEEGEGGEGAAGDRDRESAFLIPEPVIEPVAEQQEAAQKEAEGRESGDEASDSAAAADMAHATHPPHSATHQAPHSAAATHAKRRSASRPVVVRPPLFHADAAAAALQTLAAVSDDAPAATFGIFLHIFSYRYSCVPFLMQMRRTRRCKRWQRFQTTLPQPRSVNFYMYLHIVIVVFLF